MLVCNLLLFLECLFCIFIGFLFIFVIPLKSVMLFFFKYQFYIILDNPDYKSFLWRD